MASSQDIDFVPFVRTPKSSLSSAGSGHSKKSHGVPEKPRRVPPPPVGTYSIVEDTKKLSSTTRGRSGYRPATLSKPIISPVTVLPPILNQVSGAKRRSTSAPPRGVGILETERMKAAVAASGLTVIRSNSGHGRITGSTVRAVTGPVAHSSSGGEDEGIDMEGDSSGKGSPTNPVFAPWYPTLKKDKDLPGLPLARSGAKGSEKVSEGRMQVNPAFVPAPTIHTVQPQKSSFVTPSVPPAPAPTPATLAEDEPDWEFEPTEDITEAPVDGGHGESGAAAAAHLKDVESHLTSKQKRQIEKEEAKNNKALSKIIKKEGKADKVAINIAMGELEDLQRLHKQSVKLEAKALTTHSKVLSTYINALSHFEEAKQKFQGLESKVQLAAAQLEQADRALEEHKDRAREAMERVKEKREEMEEMRRHFGIEQRERAAHLGELGGHGGGDHHNHGLESRQKARSRFGHMHIMK